MLALLIAFSAVVLGAAGVMLGVAAHADVQRRLSTIGVQRALGFPRATIVGAYALRAASSRCPRRSWDSRSAPCSPPGRPATSSRRSTSCRRSRAARPARDRARRDGRARRRGVGVARPAGDRAQPRGAAARRGARARTATTARAPARGPRAARRPAGSRRRARYVGTVAVLGACVAIVALLLALASLLVALRDDPGTLGKRYDIAARAARRPAAGGRADPGRPGGSLRYQVQGADSYALGEPVRLIGFPGDHTVFEEPPLASGRRVAAPDEAEVGLGLADALNLRLGGTLAVQLESGGEATFRIVGIVRALETDGRVAYVRPDRLLSAGAPDTPQIVVRSRPGADLARIDRRAAALGAAPTAVAGATSSEPGDPRDAGVAILRVVALVHGSRVPLRARAGPSPCRPGAPRHDRGPARGRRRGAGPSSGCCSASSRRRPSRPRCSGSSLGVRRRSRPWSATSRRATRTSSRAQSVAESLVVVAGPLVLSLAAAALSSRGARCADRSSKGCAADETRARHRCSPRGWSRCSAAAATRPRPGRAARRLERDPGATRRAPACSSALPARRSWDRRDLDPPRTATAEPSSRASGRHRRARPRRGVAGPRDVPRPSRAALPPTFRPRRRSRRRC